MVFPSATAAARRDEHAGGTAAQPAGQGWRPSREADHPQGRRRAAPGSWPRRRRSYFICLGAARARSTRWRLPRLAAAAGAAGSERTLML